MNFKFKRTISTGIFSAGKIKIGFVVAGVGFKSLCNRLTFLKEKFLFLVKKTLKDAEILRGNYRD